MEYNVEPRHGTQLHMQGSSIQPCVTHSRLNDQLEKEQREGYAAGETMPTENAVDILEPAKMKRILEKWERQTQFGSMSFNSQELLPLLSLIPVSSSRRACT